MNRAALLLLLPCQREIARKGVPLLVPTIQRNRLYEGSRGFVGVAIPHQRSFPFYPACIVAGAGYNEIEILSRDNPGLSGQRPQIVWNTPDAPVKLSIVKESLV